ncbi:PREDICTED: signal recognition particle receptor subunit beta [Rhagoletis zephyria]|uniref:signal recognition particle receptor subunit beta n=1 Tax=Rhagoletis zephyria TaxID=28612 RepID=UPI000811209C|nr:PREDICTED: signal recognition particle receptor subunit beta [Rhagoletis zephyria]XP_036338096.1 signal recognition particle receptor subunit beta [Rhagoletis pomonella]XP_036338097.1 signal recognition particle receptor subunit beta [Rhagoletis pomonella]
MDKISETDGENATTNISELNMTPILLAAVLGFIIMAIILILRRRSLGRRDFLLTGLTESGKSAIFMQILHNKFPNTLTSITENLGEYRSGRMSGRLIDIPGHYRVRDKCFDQYKRSAKGIIFVVDSVTVQKEVRDVADALYSVLTDASTQSCPVLVLCNKQDLSTAKSAHVIRSVLEKELNIVRVTRSRKLQSVGEDDPSKSVFLGKDGKDFEFSHVQQNVQFFESSAKENQLNNLSDWIDRML